MKFKDCSSENKPLNQLVLWVHYYAMPLIPIFYTIFYVILLQIIPRLSTSCLSLPLLLPSHPHILHELLEKPPLLCFSPFSVSKSHLSTSERRVLLNTSQKRSRLNTAVAPISLTDLKPKSLQGLTCQWFGFSKGRAWDEDSWKSDVLKV